MSDFEFLCIGGLPIVAGFPEIRVKSKTKNYPDKIYKIGDGKFSGDNAVLEFTMPLEYAGEWDYDGEEYILFKLPEGGIRRILFYQNCQFYLMLSNCSEDKFFLFWPKRLKTSTVKAVFNSDETIYRQRKR